MTITPVTATPVAVGVNSIAGAGFTVYSETGTITAHAAVKRIMSPI